MQAICSALAATGANVVVNDINENAVGQLVEALTASGYSVHGIVKSATNGVAIVDETIRKFGAVHAVITPVLGPMMWNAFEDVGDDDFTCAFENSVLGPISVVKAAWKHFKAQKYGRVVNFTPDSLLGMPGASAYTMTKGALFGINNALALEGAQYNIKVNCVSPIVYKPQMDKVIGRFSENVQRLFREQYDAERNVPIVLALASERCSVSGGGLQHCWMVSGTECLGRY